MSVFNRMRKRLPEAINMNAPAFARAFGNDKKNGSINDSLEELNTFADDVSNITKLSDIKGEYLDLVGQYFMGLSRIYNETDADFIKRMKAFTYKNGNQAWGTKWVIFDTIQYFTYPEVVIIEENMPKNNLLTKTVNEKINLRENELPYNKTVKIEKNKPYVFSLSYITRKGSHFRVQIPELNIDIELESKNDMFDQYIEYIHVEQDTTVNISITTSDKNIMIRNVSLGEKKDYPTVSIELALFKVKEIFIILGRVFSEITDKNLTHLNIDYVGGYGSSLVKDELSVLLESVRPAGVKFIINI